ncbi:MAG: hypothetical protein ACP6IS_04850 [Candidatus Asgardarchaeia archaeon]
MYVKSHLAGIVMLLLLIFPTITLPSIAMAYTEQSTSMTCFIAEDNIIHVRLDIMLNKTLNITENINLSLYNITKYAFENNSLEFLTAIYKAYNKTVVADLKGTLTFPVIRFDDMSNSVSIMFDVSGIFTHPKLDKYGQKITLGNGYTFTMSWKNTKIDTTINVTLPAFAQYNITYVLWNSTDVFMFDKLKSYPIEKWNVTRGNFVVANISIEKNVLFLGNISLPKNARYITLSGENITYFYPIPIKESAIPIFTEVGGILILVGLLLFLATKRVSYEAKVLRKLEKKKRRKKK